MSERTHTEALSEAEERLLLMYLDGELSLLGRFKVSRLLKSSVAARDFVEEMSKASLDFKEYVLDRHLAAEESKGARTLDQSARWAQIEQRIILEQPRALQSESSLRWWEQATEKLQLFAFDREGFARVRWAASGAVLSVCVMVTTSTLQQMGPVAPSLEGLRTAQIGNLSAVSHEEVSHEDRRVAENSRGAQPVARVVSRSAAGEDQSFLGRNSFDELNADQSDFSSFMSKMQGTSRKIQSASLQDRYQPPRIVSEPSFRREAPRAIEVDWVRSRGRVRVMNDPEERASIIWVNPARSYEGAWLSRSTGGSAPAEMGAVQFNNPTAALAISSGSSLSEFGR